MCVTTGSSPSTSTPRTERDASAIWNALAARGLEPNIPVKFGIALMGVGAGFLFLVWGSQFADSRAQVGLVWLAGLYLIHSIAELCISPVGLSMITKLSIARIVGLMMGLWFLSISCAQFVAGIVAQGASVETVGGQVTNLKVSLDTYVGVFQTIGCGHHNDGVRSGPGERLDRPGDDRPSGQHPPRLGDSGPRPGAGACGDDDG